MSDGNKRFIAEACERLEASGADLLYLHQDGESSASCALVSIDWLDRYSKAETAMYEAVDGFPESTNHDHLTGDE